MKSETARFASGPEIDRLIESIRGIQLEFVEREATLRELRKLSIPLYLAESSLSYTISILEMFCVN